MKKSVLLLVLMLTVGMTVNAQKFAFIDMEYILKAIPAYEQASEQLNQATQKYQKEVEAKAQEARKLFEEYHAKVSSLSDAQKIERENVVVAKEKEVKELKQTYFGPEGELFQLREQLITPIEDLVYKAVKEVAIQNNYAAVIDRASATSVIFASPGIDVSNEVLAKLGYSN